MLRAPLSRQYQIARQWVTETRAAKRPFLRSTAKLRFHGIVFYISNRFPHLIVIPHVTIPVVRLPEAANTLQQFVGFNGCNRFPILNDSAEWKLSDSHECVNVIGHDDPREHPVTRAVVVQHRSFDKPSDARIAEETCAQASVEVVLQFYSLFARSDALRSDVRRGAPQTDRSRIALCSGARSIAPRVEPKQVLPFTAPRRRHASPANER